MSEATFSEDQFCCSVCLDLLKDPVTIPCGHSYCMSCITGCWDQDDDKGVYSCPQCRETFTPRPVVNKNTILAEMVEKLNTNLPKEEKSPARGYAESGDVECNVCTGKKSKAVKSCLMCLNSYCQNHLEQHDHFFRDKSHCLMDATGGLEKLICCEHDRPLEVFCRTDQHCICLMCVMDKHKNHDTEKASAERAEKQTELEEKRRQLREKIQQRQKKLQECKDAVKLYKCSAQEAVEESEKIFTELIRSIERSCSEVTQLIRAQEKAAVSQAEEVLERLEQEIGDLRRRDAGLEQLPHTDNDIHFLQSFQTYSVFPDCEDLANMTVSSHLSFNNVKKNMILLREKLEDLCTEKIENISHRVRFIQIIPTPDPKTREEFLQYSCQLSLDPNTAFRNLSLSDANTVVTNTGTNQGYADHPDRFVNFAQVLSRESVCGRCYWEVEWKGSWVYISVAYNSISRKGKHNECVFGCNNQSWNLKCYPFDYSSFKHNNKIIELPVVSSRIGVYVDHSAGTLAFYSISDTMTLIHKVQTTFTQPLYPGFRVADKATVKLCDFSK